METIFLNGLFKKETRGKITGIIYFNIEFDEN